MSGSWCEIPDVAALNTEVVMNASKRIWIYFLAGSLLLLPQSPAGLAQQNSAGATASTPAAHVASDERDGQHDFDPLIGKWKYHLKRRLNPLTGSNEWVELNGTGEWFK